MISTGRSALSARLISRLHEPHRQPLPSALLHKHIFRPSPRSQLRLPQRRNQTSYADQYGSTHSDYYQQPPRRSFPIRVLSGTLRYGLGAIFFTTLGAVLSILTVADRDTLLAATRRQPTDAESLTAYTPPDADTAAVNTHILNHPLSASLRSDPAFTESRPHLRMPEALRRTNLTGGTLAGPGRIAVPPLAFNERDGRSMVSLFFLGEQLCGHPGIVHGGLLATLLDEGLARCCFPALPNGIGVTANLRIDYRKPVKAGRYYVLRAQTERVEGRKAWVKGWIEELGEETEEAAGEQRPEGEGRTKLVEAEALFIEPKNAQVMKKLYSPEGRK